MLNEKQYNKIVGANLRRIMYEKGKSQADMARDLKIGKSTISTWMNGQHIPRMDKLALIAKYLGCSVIDIINVSDEELDDSVTNEQAELIRLTMLSKNENVSLALDVLKKLESKA